MRTATDGDDVSTNTGPRPDDAARPEDRLRDGWFTAASTRTGRSLGGWGSPARDDSLIADAKVTASWAQLARAFPKWQGLASRLTATALRRMIAGKPVDPNDDVTWLGRAVHVGAVLRRHGISKLDAHKLADGALHALIVGQRVADEAAGLDWLTLHPDPKVLDGGVREANRVLPIDLQHPSAWRYVEDQRRVLGAANGVDRDDAYDISRWALVHPDGFDARQQRCWRIGSKRWLELASGQTAELETVERPVGLFLAPHRDGWVLQPCVSLDMIRLAASLGGEIGRDLQSVTVPFSGREELLQRMNTNVLHAGKRELIDRVTDIMTELERIFGQRVNVTVSADKRDRWGRLRVKKWASISGADRSEAGVELAVMTTTVKGFSVKRLGSARPDERDLPNCVSAVMELGEAVNCAIERGLPLLLSSEAAGLLDGTIRVGRMKGRPGMITITSSDGLEAKTQAVSVEQAISRLRALRDSDSTDQVILDAGAKQVLRMFLARPLTDDPILLGRQQTVAAQMAVGSGVNASQTGCGKTVVTARGAIYQRAATIPGFRGLLVADGRLLRQWLEEMRVGAPGRGMPPLVPNAEFLMVDERTSIAGQIRAFHRRIGDKPGIVLVANGILERFPGDLKVLDWHLLVADEAHLLYTNTATDAHRALLSVRMHAVADCWLLTATPRGKTSEHLDVLVGLAVGDEGMISERLNVREGGDLMSELNAHRIRLNYGPHLIRITRADMKAWMPDVRPAEPIIVEADSALRELLDAIRDGGQEAYGQLLRVLASLKSLEKGSDLHKQALVEVSRCQGVVLGNVGVYVDASVDPETLKHSKAALAMALDRQGLVDAAIRGGGDGLPTLRGIVAQAIAGIIGDEQVIVFADRVRCLHQLVAALGDRHGVEAHVADGQIPDDEFEELKRRFVAGEFPVLCLSKVGQTGHNLQNATSLVQLDLPWVPTGLEQRVGRSARPGNLRGYVQTFIPYIKGAGVEHIVKILAERGGEDHLILDSYEGVSARESTIATQLGAITAQVADSKQQAGYAGTAARLRVAAAVFGA